jgi:class 3 adenylate cyclase
MGELPTGTITMLFSDIEGSTVLLQGLGDRYGEVLSAQRALLRAAFSSFGGQEMGTEGGQLLRRVRVGAGRGPVLCGGATRPLCA